MIRGFRVHPAWALAVGAIALTAVSTSASANIIDTIPEWDGERRSIGWNLIAQTLIVPVEKPILATFEVGVGSDVPDRTFTLRVYEWDRSVEHTVNDVIQNVLHNRR